MTEGLFEAFRIPEVRKRILFTLGVIIVFRLGAWIPVPGVDPEQIKLFLEGLGQIGQFLSAFTGGALERFSIFALGVIPYINASIILSLLVAVIPKLKELQEQGEEGRRTINRITRYATVGLALIQAAGTSYLIYNQGLVLPNQSLLGFMFISIITLTTGTMFLMWLGERLTENGIGRGISMLIMVGILADYPRYAGTLWGEVTSNPSPMNALWLPLILAIYVIVTASIVMVQLGARRIDIQYAKRMVKGRVYGGHSTFLPLQVNQGGVIPIIFAVALLAIPQTLLQFLEQGNVISTLVQERRLALEISGESQPGDLFVKVDGQLVQISLTEKQTSEQVAQSITEALNRRQPGSAETHSGRIIIRVERDRAPDNPKKISIGENPENLTELVGIGQKVTVRGLVFVRHAQRDWMNVVGDFLSWLYTDLSQGHALYMILSALLIFFFTYFYSAIVFNPRDLAENLRKWGGFVPGIRPGKPTADLIESVQNRLLFIGAVFLIIVALLPMVITNLSGLTAFFLGGTSLLIVVGVGVDTIKQIEAHLVERRYESLIAKGGLGRRI
ncbi:MAG: preprotein translocase subunit SecY [Candidatus Bipolaricaulota bacterium]|nr:preprotein translocase subunit SecY [Candidatus Bipolaricaulota bacterium]MDW8030274.1 preprotein translocase subunit SecY [Candidatus Bipolaricaulota bacterium]